MFIFVLLSFPPGCDEGCDSGWDHDAGGLMASAQPGSPETAPVVPTLADARGTGNKRSLL